MTNTSWIFFFSFTSSILPRLSQFLVLPSHLSSFVCIVLYFSLFYYAWPSLFSWWHILLTHLVYICLAFLNIYHPLQCYTYIYRFAKKYSSYLWIVPLICIYLLASPVLLSLGFIVTASYFIHTYRSFLPCPQYLSSHAADTLLKKKTGKHTLVLLYYIWLVTRRYFT